MTTSNNEKREQDLQQAETYLKAGSEARKNGKLDDEKVPEGDSFRLYTNWFALSRHMRIQYPCSAKQYQMKNSIQIGSSRNV